MGLFTKPQVESPTYTSVMAQADEKAPYASDSAGHSSDAVDAAGPPPPDTSRRFYKVRKTLHRLWALEAVSTLVSFVIFGLIISVLASSNGASYGKVENAKQNVKKRPQIFTILSFLGILMRAAMLLPVAAAVGQLKWSWFRSSRELLDMEKFDGASGSLLGSVKLMWMLRFRSIAVVGAALTLLAVPMDPLIQSSVLLPIRLSNNTEPYDSDVTTFNFDVTEKTFMPKAVWYDEWQKGESEDKPWPAAALINSINFGVSFQNGLADVVSAITKVNCPTGYCDFPTSQTLAVGRICVNRTDAIRTARLGNGTAYSTLPGTDLQFFNQGGNTSFYKHVITAKSYTGWPDNDFNATVYGGKVPGPLIARTAVIMDPWDTYTLGFECALHWRIQTGEAYIDDTTKYILNSTGDNDLFTFRPGSSGPYPQNSTWDIIPNTCYVEGEEVSPSDSDFYKQNCIYVVGNHAQKALQVFVQDDRDGFVGDSYILTHDEDSDKDKWSKTNNFVTNIYEAATLDQASSRTTTEDAITPEMIGKSMETLWQNIAHVMSITIRRAPSYTGDDTWNYLNTTGSVLFPEYYYEVDWVRLTMPALVLVIAALFVLWTAIMTRNEYGWRKSALPLLFHGLEDQEKAALGDVRSLLDMQGVAEHLNVKLIEHDNAQGARFKTQSKHL